MKTRISLAVAALVVLAWAPSAQAAFGLNQPDVYFANPDGTPANEAGSHPDSISTRIVFNSVVNAGMETPDETMKNLDVTLPPGLVGIPKATPLCTGAEFADVDKKTPQVLPACPNDSVIGYAQLTGNFDPIPVGTAEPNATPLYNLEPAPGTVAKFGFIVLGVPITVEVRLSEDRPYRVVAQLHNSPQPVLIFNAGLTVWGFPADDSHDPYRGACLGGLDSNEELISLGNCPVDVDTPEIAFLTAPRACEGPLTTFFKANAWESQGVFDETTSTTHDDAEPPQPIGFEDCETLEYNPESTFAGSTNMGETATGLDFDLEVDDPGIADPDLRAQSDTRELRLSLPAGVTLNPSAGQGLAGCTVAQYEAEELESQPGEGCPQAAKVGRVAIASPLVDQVLEGSLFVAASDDPEAPGQENPFDAFLAVYMVLRNQELGVIVKQAGEVLIDPASGQITTNFADIPQLPFSHVEADLRDGPRAPLVTPGQCGSFAGEVVHTPWADPLPDKVDTVAMTIASGPGGSPCQGPTGPLAPGFSAGTASNSAGTHSPFSLRFTRADGEAEITRVSVTLPPGLTGKLAGIGRCSDLEIALAATKTGRAELDTPSCPASSQVGTVVAGAGVGPALTYVSGKAYLAGPYAGAPLSMVIVTPAVAGPFDLGNVVVRQALRIDPTTAQVTADGSSATPLPRMLKGIPVRLRDLRVEVDRSNFIFNPTSCEPSAIQAAGTGSGPLIGSATETIVQVAARYQAANCSALGFRPKLTLRFLGQTKRTGHPAIRAEVLPRAGDANIGGAVTLLPKTTFIDNAHINNPCTRVQFDAEACPPSSILGRARAFSPLLDQPLEGPVYFRSNGGERVLPDLVADLRGEFRIILVGYIDSKNGRIRTRFANVPDAPVSKFVLRLFGGKRGLAQNSVDLCRHRGKAIVRFKGQNGFVYESRPKFKLHCGKGKRKA